MNITRLGSVCGRAHRAAADPYPRLCGKTRFQHRKSRVLREWVELRSDSVRRLRVGDLAKFASTGHTRECASN